MDPYESANEVNDFDVVTARTTKWRPTKHEREAIMDGANIVVAERLGYGTVAYITDEGPSPRDRRPFWQRIRPRWLTPASASFRS